MQIAPSGTRWRAVRPPRFENTDCQHDDLREFFFSPDEDEFPRARRVREEVARRHCVECPFVVECALHGLEHEDYGVWGGLSELDRSALGGRGYGVTGTRSVNRVVQTLRRAGLSDDKIKAIGLLWRARQAQIAVEEPLREETALVAPYEGEVA